MVEWLTRQWEQFRCVTLDLMQQAQAEAQLRLQLQLQKQAEARARGASPSSSVSSSSFVSFGLAAKPRRGGRAENQAAAESSDSYSDVVLPELSSGWQQRAIPARGEAGGSGARPVRPVRVAAGSSIMGMPVRGGGSRGRRERRQIAAASAGGGSSADEATGGGRSIASLAASTSFNACMSHNHRSSIPLTLESRLVTAAVFSTLAPTDVSVHPTRPSPSVRHFPTFDFRPSVRILGHFVD